MAISTLTPLNIGVIGTGGMGARHAHNLTRHVTGSRVAAIYDLDGARATHIAAQCGGAKVFPEPVALINDPSVDAIVIAAPDNTHAALAELCLQHGKSVLCEKPLGITSAEALRVIDAETRIGKRLLSLGFMRRFDPQHAAMKKAISDGLIGPARLVKSTSREQMQDPAHPFETTLLNSVVHDFDAIRWLLGEEVESVYVDGVRTRENFAASAIDLMLIQMVLTHGRLASIEAARATEYGYDIHAEVVGERGATQTLPAAVASVRVNQQQTQTIPVDWLDRFQPAYIAELQAWVDALRGDTLFPGACAWDGYLAALIAEACITSLHAGIKTPVQAIARPILYAQ